MSRAIAPSRCRGDFLIILGFFFARAFADSRGLVGGDGGFIVFLTRASVRGGGGCGFFCGMVFGIIGIEGSC